MRHVPCYGGYATEPVHAVIERESPIGACIWKGLLALNTVSRNSWATVLLCCGKRRLYGCRGCLLEPTRGCSGVPLRIRTHSDLSLYQSNAIFFKFDGAQNNRDSPFELPKVSAIKVPHTTWRQLRTRYTFFRATTICTIFMVAIRRWAA